MNTFLIIVPLLTAAGATTDANEAPLVGRREPFCEAVGSGRFEVTMRAEPRDLQAGDPLTLIVRIRSLDRWFHAPQRPDLRGNPVYRKFTEQFQIENGRQRFMPETQTWEFDYRLRPRSEKVVQIPSLVIVYFKPGFTPKERGFMTTDAPAISLHVRPRARVQATEIPGKPPRPRIPDRFYALVKGQEVLRREEPFAPPSALLIVLFLAVPPALCIGWYTAWRRLHPDAVHRVQQRRSRAARQALELLRENDGNVANACRVAGTMANYLRQRLDLPGTEAIPIDVETHLKEQGFSAALAGRVSNLFRMCDAVRFASVPPPDHDILAGTAENLIAALEAESWSRNS